MIKNLLRLIICINFLFGQGGGYALDFDGSNDYSQHGTNSSLRPSSALTIEVWVNLHTNSNWEGMVSYATDNGNTESGYDLYCKGQSTYKWSLAIARNGMSAGDWRSDPYTNLTTSQWIHIAGTYDGSTMNFYENGVLSTTQSRSGDIDWNPAPDNLYLGRFRDSDEANYFDGYLDEVRIWSDARTVTEIRDNMHKELAGNESGLVAYYQMSDGSGSSLTDNSSNSNTGTMVNMNNSDWITSYAPIGDLGSSYKTDTEGIWKSTGTNASDASDGFAVTVSSALSTGNFAVFGNNNTSGISSSDLGSVGSTRRTGRIWQVDESGTVAGTVTIDISDATGVSGLSGTASEYRLLYRSNTSGDFSSVATGASISGDVVSFTSISLADGYYVLGSQGDASLPVDLSSFNLVSSRSNAMTLEWVTESEIDNLGFIVDRRTISSDWAEIASYITHPELQGQGSVSYQTTYSFIDETVLEGETYDYRLADVDYNGTKEYHTLQLMGVSPSEPIPGNYRLHQNYPNPFNPVTTFRYDLPIDNTTRITITDIRGNEVKLYMKNHVAGSHQVQWDGKDRQGHPVSAGVYLYTIQAGDFTNTKKMILLK